MKNKMMRAAAIMMALVLVTSCFVGGTFAKYVASGESTNTARVAKWGVEVDVDSSGSFQTDYKVDYPAGTEDDDKYTFTYSVSSEDATRRSNVVAPGTCGKIEFSITGKPETAVEIKFDFDIQKDVVIPAGTTVEGLELDKAYNPVVFSLAKADEPSNTLKTGTLADIKEYLEDATNWTLSYAPNTDLKTAFGEYCLTWEWAFDATSSKLSVTGKDPSAADATSKPLDIDTLDTYLGNCAASTVSAGTDVSTDIEFTLGITVTQID